MLALILTLATALPGATKRSFQTGKLVSVTEDEKLDEGTSYRWAIFTVQIGDLVYTARGERIRRRTGDIGQGLIIGDAVQVAFDGSEYLIFLKPDGKELKAKIIKRARAQ
jgi:co-chaperonin GroES (HSP10)